MKRDTRNITTSKKLIKNTQNFLSIKYYSFTDRILKKDGLFFGWGRKISGQKALALAVDDVGIYYYDATTASKLENMIYLSYI